MARDDSTRIPDSEVPADVYELMGKVLAHLAQLDDRTEQQFRVQRDQLEGHHNRLKRLEKRDHLVSRVRRNNGLQAAVISLLVALATYFAQRTGPAAAPSPAPTHAPQ